MNETERYLNRATRGLWGKARQEARAELRGAIEDKVYRGRLLGLGEAEATGAALRDLGSSGVIARDLNRVHSLPHAARAALLAGVAALLGVRALAGVPVVRAVSGYSAAECRKLVNVPPEQRSPGERQRFEQLLREKGGVDGVLSWCEGYVTSRSDLLLLDDLAAALNAGGVRLAALSGASGFYQLFFPGGLGVHTLQLGGETRAGDGRRVMQTRALVQNLRVFLPAAVPVRLTGLENPVLHVGPAQLQLGTRGNPVRATDLYALPVSSDLEERLSSSAGRRASVSTEFEDSLIYNRPGGVLRVGTPDGTLYAVLSNDASAASPQNRPWYLVRVRSSAGGVLPLQQSRFCTSQRPCPPTVVGTLPEFLKRSERGESAVLVYRLDPADLHDLKLTPVPAAGVRVISPR